MIVVIVVVVLAALIHPDPAPGLAKSRSRARTYECERMDAEVGQERFPGEVRPSRPRGDYMDRSVLVCTERLVRPGLRGARDEAILSTLDTLTADVAGNLGALHPELATRTWLVETHYPDMPVAAKVSFAVKNALVAQGLRVSDRVPTLSAGDVDVLTRLPPEDAFGAACARYAQNGSLREGDALLVVAMRDPRETILHAGICTDGRWAWSR